MKLRNLAHVDSALVLVHLMLLSNGTFSKGADVYSPLEDDKTICNCASKNKLPKFDKAKLQPIHRRIRKKDMKEAKKTARLAFEKDQKSFSSQELNLKVAAVIKKQIKKHPIKTTVQEDESERRNVIGCVTYSEYDYSIGRVVALAVVPFKEVLDLISQSYWFVLIANKNGDYFCPAQMKIMTGS